MGQPALGTHLPRVSQIFALSVFSSGIALLAGAAAFALYHLIGFFTNLFYYERISWEFVDPANGPVAGTPWSIGVPVIGGLLVALLIRFGSEKISGHGIPEAMEAIITGRSKIQPRVGLLKPISTAIAIGSGGPFGAEGPIIQTGGTVGSIFSQFFRLTSGERRTLLACGAAAGMAATFGTPIAAVLLVIELLLFEFRARSFIPVAIASAIGTRMHFLMFSQGPLFPVPAGTNFGGLTELPIFAAFGVVCGVLAVVLTRALYGLEDAFVRLPIERFWYPALGGVAVGLLGFVVPRVLGVGYDTIQDILTDPRMLVAAVLVVLLVAKASAWLVALSTGTSGGVLAPLFVTGGAFGALFGVLFKDLDPTFVVPAAAFALAGMAAVFGAASRATFAAIVFAAEVSGAYAGLVSILVSCVVADAVMILFMGDRTIMTEKLARRGLLVRYEYETNLLDVVPVSRIMASDVVRAPADLPVSEFAARLGDPSRPESKLRSFAVTNGTGRLVGVVTRSDLARGGEATVPKKVLEVATHHPFVVRPEQPCSVALEAMVMHDIGHLPVVDRDERLVGYLSRGDLLRAWRRRIQEEREREIGFRLWRRTASGAASDPRPPPS
ncbi:MAG: chloride channel protein [Methanobacteriota archaeon]|nr:MAG: chloride channel protein [Euryarchaeota archaeon]